MSAWKQESFGLVRVPSVFLYDRPGDELGNPAGEVTDELLSGWAVALSGEEQAGWTWVRTHYGYTGWLWSGAMRILSRQELMDREALAVALPFLDLMEKPKVEARVVETLPRNSFVTLAAEQPEEGWFLIESAGGIRGFARPAALRERQEDDRFLLDGAENPGILREFVRERIAAVGEEALREGIARTAVSFLRTQYRWSGKSPAGIDCSGLAMISHLENGMLIYRDAKILPDYPIHAVEREMPEKGDLIFFKGHVAVSLGAGKYVHATAAAKTPCVTINSLNPADADYREDLAKSILAIGTVF